MSKHALTRVTFKGDQVIIVAGAVPDHIKEAAIEIAPVVKPSVQRTIPKPPVPPARVPRGAKVPDAPIQAEPPKAVEENE